jgi:hypothetical protein
MSAAEEGFPGAERSAHRPRNDLSALYIRGRGGLSRELVKCPLDNAAIVRPPHGSVVQSYAVLFAAAAQGLPLEFRRVIHVLQPRFAAHRPVPSRARITAPNSALEQSHLSLRLTGQGRAALLHLLAQQAGPAPPSEVRTGLSAMAVNPIPLR